MSHLAAMNPRYLPLTDTSGWKGRHDRAMHSSPVWRMTYYWIEYAEDHKLRYDSLIGEDYYLGKEWETIGQALRNLLNGELNGLDGGTMDAIIVETLKSQGFEVE